MASAAGYPFPGMNPYLEWHWGDVHQSVVTYARDALNERLPRDLVARMEERVYLESDVDQTPGRMVFVPDVHVAADPHALHGAVAIADPPAATSAQPIVLQYDVEPLTEAYIEVRDAKSGGRVVTVIELISPGNKSGGEGESKYLAKQLEMRRAGANLVEIDLVRGGRHVLAYPRKYLPTKYDSAYKVCVTRAAKPKQAEWYSIGLRDRLPQVSIPLRQDDADVTLDLQALLERAYRMGRYDRIDYSHDAIPPLTGDDAAWSDELLKSKGLR